VDLLRARDIALLRADNPGPFSLTGTNSYAVGRDPAWVIDPGPALVAHLDALASEVARRGGLAGIALTHDHPDHTEAVAPLLERAGGAPVAAARGDVDIRVADGDSVGPLRALATPGHAPDHLAFVLDDVAFTGDAVLGEGSVFIAPNGGALAGYLAGLERLLALPLALLCPGHGPLVDDPAAKLREYIDHRLDREAALVAALEHGDRTIDALLDSAWADVPAPLRGAATVTLAAHLDKLAGEGCLPEGVERPQIQGSSL